MIFFDSNENITSKFLFLEGFGTFNTFGKNNKKKKSFSIAIEEIADDLESQHVQEIMGISEFGRKAKSFCIQVRTNLKFNSNFFTNTKKKNY